LNRLPFEISNSQPKKDRHDAGINNDTHIAPIATCREAPASLPNNRKERISRMNELETGGGPQNGAE
jgi:hypothetical protein